MTDQTSKDLLHRYIFEQHHVRGELVQISDSFDSMLKNHDYPIVVKRILGELLAVTSLMTATLKFEGEISVQLQGDGPLRYAVVNGNHQQQLRATAKFADDIQEGNIQQLIGNGVMVITIAPKNGEKYQGVAALDKPSLTECVEQYFESSEQLRTRIWLATDLQEGQHKAAGMLLQILPVTNKASADFQHLEALTQTIKDEELLHLPAEQVLIRLYHEDNPKLFEPQEISYECGCSRDKTANAIVQLSYDDAMALIAEQGKIEITCQFCLTPYHFDAIDVEAVFKSPSSDSDAIN